MPVQQEQLRDRTKAFAVRIVRLYRSLPVQSGCASVRKAVAPMRNSGRGELSSGMSFEIQSRMARENRSLVVLEEADESVFWLEMLSDCEIVPLRKTEAANRGSA